MFVGVLHYHYVQKQTCRPGDYQVFFLNPALKNKDNIISTASSFGRIRVGLRMKNRNPTSQILPQILRQELLKLWDLVLQLALAKRHFAYNFKFLRRQYRAGPNQNSLIIVPQFYHRTCTMVKSPIKESNDGLHCKRHYEFSSWQPVILKSPIDFNHPTLLIKPIRITGFHHPQPENTQARRIDNALCLKIADK